jgi:hypothetical protein
LDLGQALGASNLASLQRFALYLPDRDRDGIPVPQLEKWIGAAMALFANVNGGATRLPTAQGLWKPEDGSAEVREATVVVYSFIRDTARFHANIGRLAAFTHSFGKHAKQGEVMVEFSGEVPGRGFVSRAYFIDDYAKAGPPPF